KAETDTDPERQQPPVAELMKSRQDAHGNLPVSRTGAGIRPRSPGPGSWARWARRWSRMPRPRSFPDRVGRAHSLAGGKRVSNTDVTRWRTDSAGRSGDPLGAPTGARPRR